MRTDGAADGQTDRLAGGQTDTKLIVAFRNFANAPKNAGNFYVSHHGEHDFHSYYNLEYVLCVVW
jgi:hypothetical protein